MLGSPTSSDAEKGLASREAMFIIQTAAPDTTTTTHTKLNFPEKVPSRISESPASHAPLEGASLLSRIWKLISSKSGEGQPIDTADPPDGGLQAWTVALMCHLMGFHTWGFLNAFGVLQPFYVAHLQRSPSDISWIGSIQGFFLMFTSTFSGRLTDAGYFHQLLFVGCVLQITGVFAVAQATTYWQVLLCHGLGLGLGGGIMFIPSMSLVATYFKKNRPVALALVVCGNSAGGLVYAALLQNTLPSVGYTWTMRICGFVMLSTFIPANWLLKPRRIERKEGPLVDWKAFIEPAYGVFTAGMFCCTVGQWIPVFYLGSFGRDVIGITAREAADLLLVMNGVGLFGRLIPTALAPFCGPLNLIVPLSLFSAIILFGWAGVSSRSGAIIFDVFYGMVMAAAQGMLPPSLGSLTHDLSKMGVRLGMVFSVLGFALLIGNPFAGWLLSLANGRYIYAQMMAGTTMMAGAVLLGVARWCVTGKKVFVKV